MRKVGAAFDLPIALGILAASGALPHHPNRTISSSSAACRSTAACRRCAACCPSRRWRGEPAPASCSPTAISRKPESSTGLPLFPVRSLLDAARVLVSPARRPIAAPPPRSDAARDDTDDLADVRGQSIGRRALEIAAAGAHHLLFSGPPGAGKTMLASAVAGSAAAAHLRRGADGHDDSFGRRHAASRAPGSDDAASVSRAASHVLGSRIDWRRLGAAAGRTESGAPRRAVPRRAAGVQPARARNACASRSSRASSTSRAPHGRSPFPRGHARRRDESVPVRLRGLGSTERASARPRRSIAIAQRPSGPLLDRFDLLVDLPPVPWAEIAAS